MTRPYLSASLIIIAVLGLRFLCQSLPEESVREEEITAAFPVAQGETALALGRPLSFASADLYELELIPGISDALAERLLLNRKDILKKARQLPPERRHIALQIVKGIGPEKASALAPWLDLATP